MRAKHGTFPVIVQSVEQVTPIIRTYRLVDPANEELPGFSGGSHIVVLIENGEVTFRNPYSLMGSPFDRRFYEIAVCLQPNGRGGSKRMHETVGPGTTLQITYPANQFPLEPLARKHILVAGGVGITPILSQLQEIELGNTDFELHYAARSLDDAKLADRIPAALYDRVKVYPENMVGRINFASILKGHPLGSHLYICGPKGMLEEALQTAEACGWPESHIHFERFTQRTVGNAFEASFAKSHKIVSVPAELSLLEAAEAAGITLPYLCRGGACGFCETDVLKLDGDIIHNDVWLTESAKLSNKKIMPCVSRANCTQLILDA